MFEQMRCFFSLEVTVVVRLHWYKCACVKKHK